MKKMCRALLCSVVALGVLCGAETTLKAAGKATVAEFFGFSSKKSFAENSRIAFESSKMYADAKEHLLNVDYQKFTEKDVFAAALCGDMDTLRTFKQYDFLNWQLVMKHLLDKCGEAPVYIYPEVLEFCMENRADVRMVGKNGYNVLHVAAQSGKLNFVKKFQERGADVSLKTNEGFTALHFAVQSGELETVKYLLTQGLDVAAVTKDAVTALHLAGASGDLELVKFLMMQGLDVNTKDKFSHTVFHYTVSAAFGDHVDLVVYLLNQGMDINQVDDEGKTLLFMAVECEKLDLLKFLIKQGANLNIVANDGTTLLHSAAKTGNMKLVQFLVKQGVDVSACNKKGEMASSENPEVDAFLKECRLN